MRKDSFIVILVVLLAFGPAWLFKEIELRDRQMMEYEKLIWELKNTPMPEVKVECPREKCSPWLITCPEGYSGPMCHMDYCNDAS